MMKLGKLTDYAVVVTVQLARESRASSAQTLSVKTGIPAPTVAKVLKKLAKYGLVSSLRGAAGGYRLAKTPREISACDVIEAMDGPVAIAGCVASVCSTQNACPAKGKWAPVNAAIRAALKAVTIADMAATEQPQRRLVQIAGGECHAGIA